MTISLLGESGETVEIFKYYVGIAGYIVEGTGVLVILSGSLAASAWFLFQLSTSELTALYTKYRIVLGRIILLGLEFLIAGDIIRTVVIKPTLEQIGVLVVIVLIRTFLSFTLELEIEGKWPWQRSGDLYTGK